MLSRLRRSFAAKIVALEIGTIVLASAAVAGLLILSRNLATRELEQNVASTAAGSLRTDLNTAGANAHKLAQGLAAFPAIRDEFGSPDATRLDALLSAEVQTLPRGETLVALDAQGRPLLARAANGSGGVDTVDAAPFAGLGSVAAAGQGHEPNVGMIEPVSGTLRLDAPAAVVRGGATAGFVMDSQGVQAFLDRNVRPNSGVQFGIFQGGRRVASTLPGARPGDPQPSSLGEPDGSGGRFGVYDAGGKTYAGYFTRVDQGENLLVAAEVDDSVFATQRLNDDLVVILATTLVATVMSLVAVYFARRTAVQPLNALAAGAERVKAGDYAARVNVQSEDDFGRLATAFNDMAAQIRRDTGELERQRARLDAALHSLGSVSRALTATTAGEAQLRQAVLEAVLEMTRADAVAMYEGTDRPRVTAGRGLEAGQARALLGLMDSHRVLQEGESLHVRLERAPEVYRNWTVLAVPMLFQGRPAGMLAAFSRGTLDGIDIPSLQVLANQAVVALQNTVLFQRERQTVARLQELDAMKSDFLATIQHELRTPLTAIMGMADLLEMAWASWGDEQKLEAIADVQVAAKSLYEIVETILDYSMLESDRVHLTLTPLQLRAAAEEAIEELRPLIRRSDVRIDLKVPARVRVQADERRLVQVMKALIDNAVKFSPEKARVEVRAEQRNGRVHLEVVDRGIGIAPEHLQQVFERFFQVDNTATRRYGGTGMGLALVKKLVEMHQGKVTVSSTVGKGSTFTVTLPGAN